MRNRARENAETILLILMFVAMAAYGLLLVRGAS
jgi:hypothetical protein